MFPNPSASVSSLPVFTIQVEEGDFISVSMAEKKYGKNTFFALVCSFTELEHNKKVKSSLPATLKTAESRNNRPANMTVQTAFYIITMLTTLKNSGKLKTINSSAKEAFP